jgi:hypothetical protein
MSVNSIIVKKHLRTNKKNLILNFFSLVFSLFALVFVVVVLMNSNNLEAQILNTYPNKNVYQVSKKINITDSNISNGLIQLNRPTENELKNVKEFKDSFFDIDLFYLFDSYEVTKDNLQQAVQEVLNDKDIQDNLDTIHKRILQANGNAMGVKYIEEYYKGDK